jgi:probable rRNA maturation factor
LPVIFNSTDVKFNLKDKIILKNWIYSEIKSNSHLPGQINIIFCSDEYLLEINQKYLNHDYYTDIITFNYNEDLIVSGDLYISIDRVKENANNFKIETRDELSRVIIHGILHLLGYEDYSPELKKLIHDKEDEALKRFSSFKHH